MFRYPKSTWLEIWLKVLLIFRYANLIENLKFQITNWKFIEIIIKICNWKSIWNYNQNVQLKITFSDIPSQLHWAENKRSDCSQLIWVSFFHYCKSKIIIQETLLLNTIVTAKNQISDIRYEIYAISDMRFETSDMWQSGGETMGRALPYLMTGAPQVGNVWEMICAVGTFYNYTLCLEKFLLWCILEHPSVSFYTKVSPKNKF